MGITGTDVSKEASDIILKDDNFASIVEAVKEGRKIYNNIKSFIKYLFSANFGELLTVSAAFFAGLPLPLTPIQILWVNLVTDGLPALALGNEPAHENIMNEKPRNPKESLFKRTKTFTLAAGVLAAIATLSSFLIGLNESYATALTMALTTIILFELILVFSCRVEGRGFWEVSLSSNKGLLAAVLVSFLLQIMILYVPFFSQFFGTIALQFRHWVIIISVSLLALLAPLAEISIKGFLSWLGVYSDSEGLKWHT
ncbi:cation-transporting P-type ATPase [archaeon]|nr:cation-transporting P-type ATPase [archaeon]